MNPHSDTVQNWFTAKELAGLAGMPGTERGVKKFADREGWEGQRRLGSKALEYHFAVLPAETQDAILLKRADDTSGVCDGELITTEDNRLNDNQRAVMSARVAFVRAIERMKVNVSQQHAIETLVGLARDNQLPPYLAQQVVRANDRKTDTRTLSERTLKRWIGAFNKDGERALAPKRRKADLSVPEWAKAFLSQYQRPQKPSVEAAYSLFTQSYSGDKPSIHQVRRWLAKLSPETRERGRMGAHELNTLQPFRRRNTDHLLPNDVWVADGHTFDAEVINPLTGQPFRPEVTMVIDWATRRIVGYALNLAESTLATIDALRDSITRAGMFNLFYVDNGAGFKNEAVLEVIDRLGGTVTHSLPYNSQARGVIERAHQSILVRLSKTLPSYIGADMDKEAATKAHRISRREIKAGNKSNIPSFQEFWERLNNAINEYNFKPHSGLARQRDLETGNMRHQSPMEAWASAEAKGFEPLKAPAGVVESLVRPQEVRITHRGEVKLAGGIYYLDALRDFHGEEIRVGWDYRDSSRVWAHTLDGELIGEAALDGNSTPAMPMAAIERAKEKRERGQMARLVQKAKVLTGQQVEIRAVEEATPETATHQRRVEAAREKAKALAHQPLEQFELPQNKVARFRFWKRLDAQIQEGKELGEKALKWHASYPQQQEFRSIAKVMDTEVEADGGQPTRNRKAM